jgi:twitching motility protein PilT
LDHLERGAKATLRCRINIYMQKDAHAIAIRNIPSIIPSFEELGLPDIVRDFAPSPTGWC